MAAVMPRKIDKTNEHAIRATRVLYVTARKSLAGDVVARKAVAAAIEAYDKAYLALRGIAIESAR